MNILEQIENVYYNFKCISWFKFETWNTLLTPIYFLIGFFFQIDKTFRNEIETMFGDDNVNTNNDHMMINNEEDFCKLKKNKNLFVKSYYDSELSNSLTNCKYFNIIMLRDDTPYSIYFYKPFHFLNFNYYFEHNSEKYSIYKFNTITCDLIIHNYSNNISYIRSNISENYQIIQNILKYKQNYNQINTFSNINELYIKWVEPIEPSDKINWDKLTTNYIDKKEYELDNIKYTDIITYRNFIQKDFYDNIKDLIKNPNQLYPINNDLQEIVNKTIYRINNTTKRIITILD